MPGLRVGFFVKNPPKMPLDSSEAGVRGAFGGLAWTIGYDGLASTSAASRLLRRSAGESQLLVSLLHGPMPPIKSGLAVLM